MTRKYRLTSDDYRAKAHEGYKEAEDSWNRCDTDGFLSQWSNNINARLNDRKADLVDAGNISKFTGLYEGDRRVKAKKIETKFGYSWLLHADEVDLVERRGKCFLPTGKKSRILKKLGLAERTETAPAWAGFGGGGTGLAGCASVTVVTFRTGDKWGGDATLIIEEKES
jgi:hypothetical protein